MFETTYEWIQVFATWVIFAPVVGFVALGGSFLARRLPSERALSRVTMLVFSSAFVSSLVVVACMRASGIRLVRVSLGDWFRVGAYGFELHLLVDRLSAPMMVLAAALCGVVGEFSVSYLHREAGARRFLLLLTAFAAGIELVVMAGSLDVMFVGWEIVGVTSVLLIAFFQERTVPVQHAMRAFVTYRMCDIGLISAAVLLHHFVGTADLLDILGGASWPEGHASVPRHVVWEIGALLIFASLGKSAQWPLSGWLPRAMEGPTPSSAIFYGALSVHAGAYLLLRFYPLLAQEPGLLAVVVIIGLVSAVHGTLVGRVQPDVKSALAYASITQVGVIYIEIGLGLSQLALVHLLGHAALRSVQLLRAPSVLHEHTVHRNAVGPMLGRTGAHLERLFPEAWRARIYAWALSENHLDAALRCWVVEPVLALFRRLDRLERAWTSRLSGTQPPPPERAWSSARSPSSPPSASSYREDVL